MRMNCEFVLIWLQLPHQRQHLNQHAILVEYTNIITAVRTSSLDLFRVRVFQHRLGVQKGQAVKQDSDAYSNASAAD